VSLRRFAILAAAPALAVALSGCISVLPKSKPDQLYSFGADVGTQPAATPDRRGAQGVLLATVAFPRAATGDGILTVTGDRSAYIAMSRWVGPASVLFREAVETAFDRTSQRTLLLARGETGRDILVLRLDVRDFEALYPNGEGSIPTVAVSFRARLSRPDGVAVDEKTFDVRKQASDNRVGPIVQAFDAATNEALKGLVAWTDQAVAAQPPPPPPAPVAAR
jgi:cholesterol transport system auxiliary component